MYTYIVGVSRNDHQVYTKIIGSTAGRCFSRQPYLVRIVKDVLETIDLSGQSLTLSRDLGRVIGNTSIVATGEKDAIFYARPPKQTNNLRFVKNRSMAPSSELTMILEQDESGNYELVNVWIGPSCPPFPDAANARKDSLTYWQSHALTVGSEAIDLQTVTSVCPY